MAAPTAGTVSVAVGGAEGRLTEVVPVPLARTTSVSREGNLKINCKVAAASYGSYAPGKGRITIHRPGKGTANVRFLKDDDELRTMLSDLGFQSQEIDSAIQALTDRKVQLTQPSDLTESQVARYGF